MVTLVLHVVATANGLHELTTNDQVKPPTCVHWLRLRLLVFVVPHKVEWGESNMWAVVHSSREYKIDVGIPWDWIGNNDLTKELMN